MVTCTPEKKNSSIFNICNISYMSESKIFKVSEPMKKWYLNVSTSRHVNPRNRWVDAAEKYPSEKYQSQLGLWHSQYMESHKIHVLNHQPVMLYETGMYMDLKGHHSYTGWDPPVISWFKNHKEKPMNTSSLYLPIYHRIQPLTRQLNAILGAPLWSIPT